MFINDGANLDLTIDHEHCSFFHFILLHLVKLGSPVMYLTHF